MKERKPRTLSSQERGGEKVTKETTASKGRLEKGSEGMGEFSGINRFSQTRWKGVVHLKEKEPYQRKKSH